jgi:hypothetical protein
MAEPAGAGGAAAAALAAAVGGPGNEEEEEAEEEEEQESGEEEDEEDADEDEDLVDPAAIQGLLAEFRGSLDNVFGYSAVAAQAIQEHLSLIEPVDLQTNWINDEDLRTACTTLMRNAKDFKVGNVKPVFKLSLAADLILYQDWVCLRLSWGLSAEAANFRRSERQFMVDWRRKSKEIKVSLKQATKSELEVLQFNQKYWVKWYNSIDSYFRRTLGVRSVAVDWIYCEQKRPMPRATYPLIADELKATLILEGSHFTQDSRTVYAAVASSMLDTPAYAHVRRFSADWPRGHAHLEGSVQWNGFQHVSVEHCA